MGIVVFFVDWRQAYVTRQQAEEHGAALARAVADLSWNALVHGDQLALRQNTEKAATDSDIFYAVIFNKKGQPLAANEEAQRRLPPQILEPGEAFPRLRRGQVSVSTVVFPEEPGRPRLEALEVLAPVVVGPEGDIWGAVKLGLSLEPRNAEIQQTRIGLISLGFFGLTLGTLGSMLLARRISGPLETLVEGTIKVAERDLHHYIAIPPGDEIGELAANFNRMTAQILEDRQQIEETSKKLIQAEKLATIGKLSAAVAHEIRNPLTSIKLNIQKVGKSPSLTPLESEQLDLAERGIRQVEKIVREILDYARPPNIKKDSFQLDHLLEDALRFAQEQLEEKGVEVVKEYSPELPPLRIDGDKMRQVFLNVLLNSVEALGSRGRIILRTFRRNGEMPEAVVQVEDNGAGIDAADIPSVFEPFFTTKSLGTGLGLANARKLIEMHHGRVEVSSERSVGTTITISLPCETPDAAMQALPFPIS
jgi:signal transduction histidine kinase